MRHLCGIDDLLHVEATSILSQNASKNCIVGRCGIFSLFFALKSSRPKLMGPLDVFVIVFLPYLINKGWSEAFEDDYDADLEARPEIVEDLDDLVLHSNVDIAMAILQILKRVALRDLA